MRLRSLAAVPWYGAISLLLGVSGAVADGGLHPVPTVTMSLRDAYAAAWKRQPQAASEADRQAELAAKAGQARRWLDGVPALAIEQQRDAPGEQRRAREVAADLSLPLRLPAQRAAATVVAEQEKAQRGADIDQARWRLAGDVRTAYWELVATRHEWLVAQHQLREAQLLAQDVARRAAAGESAKVDMLQAEAATLSAASSLAETRARLLRANQQLRALTGFDGLPTSMLGESSDALPIEVTALRAPAASQPLLPDALEPAAENLTTTPPPLDQHPAVRAARADAETARARLAEAKATPAAAPELGVGVRRERGGLDEPAANSVRLSLRIPLGGSGWNASRIAAAGAELTEAEVADRNARMRVEAEIEGVRSELSAARQAAKLAAARVIRSEQALQLYARGYRLGEVDLPTRLRAEHELAEARLAAVRAAVEVGRATSRLYQAQGLLP